MLYRGIFPYILLLLGWRILLTLLYRGSLNDCSNVVNWDLRQQLIIFSQAMAPLNKHHIWQQKYSLAAPFDEQCTQNNSAVFLWNTTHLYAATWMTPVGEKE